MIKYSVYFISAIVLLVEVLEFFGNRRSWSLQVSSDIFVRVEGKLPSHVWRLLHVTTERPRQRRQQRTRPLVLSSVESLIEPFNIYPAFLKKEYM